MDSRDDITAQESREFAGLFDRIEKISRHEILRQQRSEITKIVQKIAISFRAATRSEFGNAGYLWGKIPFRPPPPTSFFPPSPQFGTIIKKYDFVSSSAPSKSSLRPPDSPTGLTTSRNISFAHHHHMRSFVNVPIEDWHERKTKWSHIMAYAPLKQMIMSSLKNRFGGDAADPDSWVSAEVELLPWLEDLYIDVKDIYQLVYSNEDSDFEVILNTARLEKSRIRY